MISTTQRHNELFEDVLPAQTTYSFVVVDSSHSLFEATVELVRQNFKRSYGADITPSAKKFVVLIKGQQVLACTAISDASSSSVFSEIYLPKPIDVLIAEREGGVVLRSDILEVGSFAAVDANSSVLLFTEVPRIVSELGFQYVLITVGSAVKALLDAKGVRMHVLCEAKKDCLPLSEQNNWGTFYNTRPVTGYLNINPTLSLVGNKSN